MATYLLDTNVLVRYLTNDHAAHSKEVAALFGAAEKGRHRLVVTALVVAETAFVLRSFYRIEASRIADALRVLLSQRWITVEERPCLLAMLPAFAEGVHFVDAYLAARSQNEAVELYTFDKKLRGSASPARIQSS
jgi:predicted nucleic acid-binding protein